MIHSSRNSLKIRKSKSLVVSNLGNSNEESNPEISIRPSRLSEIVGRDLEKKTLGIMIDSAKRRKESLDHVLFYGPPGLGKTTFAMAIANDMGSSLRVTSGPAIEKQGDLAAILTNLKPFDVLFIDEIHRLARSVEEILYPAMEDRVIDIVMGKGPSAKTIRLNLEPFTLVGATTQVGKISPPMRDRFGLIQRLDYFGEEELTLILKRAIGLLDLKYSDKALGIIAKRSRGTARVALRLLRRARDFSESKYAGVENDVWQVEKVLELLGIDELGLEDIDRKILTIMFKNFNGGPVGLSTLAASVSEDSGTIEDVYEPFLMKMGLLQRTSRGRVLTELGLRKSMDILGITSMI